MFSIMTRGDKILIVTILVFSIASIFAIPTLLSSASDNKTVLVNIDGREVASFPLLNKAEPEFKEIPFSVKGKEYIAKFEMKDGKIMLHRLPDEVVPLSIHKDMGWISEPYQMIVALPVKMYVTIESDKQVEDDMIDIIVY